MFIIAEQVGQGSDRFGVIIHNYSSVVCKRSCDLALATENALQRHKYDVGAYCE